MTLRDHGLCLALVIYGPPAALELIDMIKGIML